MVLYLFIGISWGKTSQRRILRHNRLTCFWFRKWFKQVLFLKIWKTKSIWPFNWIFKANEDLYSKLFTHTFTFSRRAFGWEEEECVSETELGSFLLDSVRLINLLRAGYFFLNPSITYKLYDRNKSMLTHVSWKVFNVMYSKCTFQLNYTKL